MTDGTVYVIGLDGVPPELLSRGIEAGQLPTFARLADEGARGTTKSTLPPISMMAWSTFATGQNPGNHGIFNFLLKEENGYGTEFATADQLRANAVPFWEHLDVQGVSTGVMNVMPGYPPPRTKGFHISDHITTPPGAPFAHPPALAEEFQAAFDEFQIGPPTAEGGGMDRNEVDEYVERFFAVERDRIDATKALIEQWDCRVMLLVFSAPDVLLHEIGHLRDPDHPDYRQDVAKAHADTPLDLLEEYDSFLEWLTDRMANDDTLVVLSDHGHGPIYSAFNLNSWLHQEGFLSLKSTPLTLLKRVGYNHLFDTAKKGMKRLGLYHHIKRRVARSSGDGGRIDWARLLTISQHDIDWVATEAFTVAGDGQIYINTIDHADGTVSSAEYKQVRDSIRTALLELEDPVREQSVIAAVEDGEDAYADGQGPCPDLVCVPEQGYRLMFPQTMQTGQVFGEPQKPASHTSAAERDGVFIAWGDAVCDIDDVSVGLDEYAPTIFHLLDLPIPDVMDGTPRSDVFECGDTSRESYDGRVSVKRTVRSVVRSL